MAVKKKPDLNTLIKKAKSLVGSQVKDTTDNRGDVFTITTWDVVYQSEREKAWEDAEISLRVNDRLKKEDWCVVIIGDDFQIPVDEAEEYLNTFKLTDDYDADIDIGENIVTVGCQDIPFSKIAELVKRIETLSGHGIKISDYIDG